MRKQKTKEAFVKSLLISQKPLNLANTQNIITQNYVYLQTLLLHKNSTIPAR